MTSEEEKIEQFKTVATELFERVMKYLPMDLLMEKDLSTDNVAYSLTAASAFGAYRALTQKFLQNRLHDITTDQETRKLLTAMHDADLMQATQIIVTDIASDFSVERFKFSMGAVQPRSVDALFVKYTTLAQYYCAIYVDEIIDGKNREQAIRSAQTSTAKHPLAFKLG